MSTEEAFKALPEIDSRFLQELVAYLSEQKPNIEIEFNRSYAEMESDEENNYGKKICDLLSTLCRNYEILLIKPTDCSNQLFSLLKAAAMAKNKCIATSTIDFWDEFYETITNRL